MAKDIKTTTVNELTVGAIVMLPDRYSDPTANLLEHHAIPCVVTRIHRAVGGVSYVSFNDTRPRTVVTYPNDYIVRLYED